jgi:hypothetical protein
MKCIRKTNGCVKMQNISGVKHEKEEKRLDFFKRFVGIEGLVDKPNPTSVNLELLQATHNHF